MTNLYLTREFTTKFTALIVLNFGMQNSQDKPECFVIYVIKM